jgi:hypothetical protein
MRTSVEVSGIAAESAASDGLELRDMAGILANGRRRGVPVALAPERRPLILGDP